MFEFACSKHVKHVVPENNTLISFEVWGGITKSGDVILLYISMCLIT